MESRQPHSNKSEYLKKRKILADFAKELQTQAKNEKQFHNRVKKVAQSEDRLTQAFKNAKIPMPTMADVEMMNAKYPDEK